MPYSCELCHRTFTFQQSYHRHLSYHTNDRPHSCSICGRAFKELSTLHNHQRIHSGEKPFECETCGSYSNAFSNPFHKCVTYCSAFFLSVFLSFLNLIPFVIPKFFLCLFTFLIPSFILYLIRKVLSSASLIFGSSAYSCKYFL